MTTVNTVARTLGWVSIGLGIAALVSPRKVLETIGVSPDSDARNMLGVVGFREIGSGLALLTTRSPVVPQWSRVAGDFMDLVLLNQAMMSPDANRSRLNATTAVIAGLTATDVLTSLRLGHSNGHNGASSGKSTTVQVRKAITINKPADELYAYWRDFQNLPNIMRHLENVSIVGPNESHWKAKAPLGQSVEWDAEIVEDRPGELIAWQSLPNADIENSGRVRFVPAPADRGTEVHVELTYAPPGGKAGKMIALLLGEEPGFQISDDLHLFKQVMELGEVVLSEAKMPGAKAAQPSPQAPVGIGVLPSA